MGTKGNAAIIPLVIAGIMLLIGGTYFFLSYNQARLGGGQHEATAAGQLLGGIPRHTPSLINPIVAEAYDLTITEAPVSVSWVTVAEADKEKTWDQAVGFESDGKTGYLKLTGLAWSTPLITSEAKNELADFEKLLLANGWTSEILTLKDVTIKPVTAEGLCTKTKTLAGLKNNHVRFYVLKTNITPCGASPANASGKASEAASLFISNIIPLEELQKQLQ